VGGMIGRLLALALVVASGLPAAALRLEGSPQQGALMRGETVPGAATRLDGRPLRVAPDGGFVFGFGRDHPPRTVLEIQHPDSRVERHELAVAQRQYPTQRIDGLPERMVRPSEADLRRIAHERQLVLAARLTNSPLPHFRQPFIWPVQGVVTGVYGSQRILNGEPRQPHFGIDIAAPEGTPTLAAADGIVLLAEADLYFTGGTLLLDHGHGVSSTYSHLSRLSVVAGQVVRQGEVVGAVGRTGRATGPHLDWRVNWFEERLDPQLLLPRGQ